MVHLELPENWQDLAAGYVLDNLNEEEVWVWEMLLNDHPELQHEIQKLEMAFNGLSDAVPQHQPPPDLLHRIRSTVQSDQDLTQQAIAGLPKVSSTFGPRQGTQQQVAHRIDRRPIRPLPHRSSSRMSRISQIGGAIAAGVIAVLGFQVYTLQNQLKQTDTDLQLASGQIKVLNRQLRQAEAQTLKAQPVVQSLQQPGNLIYSLAGSNLADRATGSLVMSDEQQVVIVVQNLPQLPEDKVYRLWAALETKEVVYCGQFNSNTQGIIQLIPSSDHCGENPSQMIITLDAVTDPTTQGGPVVMQSSI